MEPGFVQQHDAHAAQELHDELDQEEPQHGPGHLVVGEAVADGQGGVELQAHGTATHKAQHQELRHDGGAVDGVIGGKVAVDLLEQLPEARCDLLDQFHIKGHDQAGQANHHQGQSEPDGGDDKLAPDVLVDGDGQGHHHIALVLEQVLVEPLDHDHHAHDTYTHDGNDECHDQQGAQDVQEPAARIQHPPDGEVGTHGGHQQDQEQGQHDAARGTELVLHQFSQHLNTSRNSASTLMPFSSRISSTEDWSTTRPWLMKMTSSSTFSTSEMRWVEITTAASGL